MKGKELGKKLIVYLIAALILNAVCLIIAHLGWVRSGKYWLVLVLSIAVFLFYYWMECFAHRHFHCKRKPFALFILFVQFFLSFPTTILYCSLFGIAYEKLGMFQLNDAEWMYMDITCTILYVIVFRLVLGVVRYVVHVMKKEDFL